MKFGKLVIAAAVVGSIAAGVAVALKTPKGKAAADKVVGKAKEGMGKVKEGANKVKAKFVKKNDAEVVADATCEEVCPEEMYEDELPDVDPVEVVEVEEEA